MTRFAGILLLSLLLDCLWRRIRVALRHRRLHPPHLGGDSGGHRLGAGHLREQGVRHDRTCAYHGKDAVKQSVVLVVATPAPKVSTSAELAALRNEQAQRPAGHLPVQLQGSSREHVRQGRSEVVQGGGAVSRKRSDGVD